MPIEVFDTEEFIELSEKAEECRIKRNKDNTKLKLRTGKYLYTLKLNPEDAQSVISKLSCPTVEV
jgi:large subunit ribosomal protein L38e